MSEEKILIVEDDQAIRQLLETTLKVYGYENEAVSNGAQALERFVHMHPDIVILDLGLPDIDGIEFIKAVRTFSNIPIMVLSARNQDSQKVSALDSGADDYLTKPFDHDEFLARIRALLRRSKATQAALLPRQSYTNQDLYIDYEARRVSVGGKNVHLTPIEYKLIELLSKNTGKVMTYNQILKEVWGGVYESDLQSLRVFMTGLRKKIEGSLSYKFIQTHVGVGYCMVRPEDTTGRF